MAITVAEFRKGNFPIPDALDPRRQKEWDSSMSRGGFAVPGELFSYAGPSTPQNPQPVAEMCKAFWVIAQGDVEIVYADGHSEILPNLPVGYHPWALIGIGLATTATVYWGGGN